MRSKNKSLWRRFMSLYHRPWRSLSNYWYQFTCWAWYRYRTVKPESLPGHGWIDRDELMLHCMFSCLIDCVDKENLLTGHIDWDYDDKHRQVKKEIEELYHWWKNIYLKEIYPQGDPTHTKNYDEVSRQCHRLIDIRGYLWT